MGMISLRKGIEQYGPLLGINIMYPSPGVIEGIGRDWDWVWLDAQHGQFGYDSLLACVRACDLVQRPAVIRVPNNDYGSIGSAFDTCASGVMVPMVEGAEEARAAVRAARFPPLGGRSYGGRRPIDLYGREYAHSFNDDSTLIVQIETRRGLENCDEIASVPGVDALLFGPDDMAMQAGMPMNEPRDAQWGRSGLERIAQAAARHGKIAAGLAFTPETLSLLVALGYGLIVGGADRSILLQGSQQRSAELKSVMQLSLASSQ